MRFRALLSTLIFAGTLAGGAALAQSPAPSPAPASSGATSGDVAHGKQLFADNCAACHGAKGEGGVGPSLQGEHARKDAAQVAEQIKNPAPPMPKLYPSPLSEKDVADVTAFVETL